MRGLFAKVTEESKKEAVSALIRESTPDADFFFMVILAVLMGTFGILLNNIPVLIGSMLLSPLLSPILSMALGVVLADGKLILRSVSAIAKALAFSVILSFVVSLLLIEFIPTELTPFFHAWNLFFIYFLVSVIAGLAVSYSVVSTNPNALVVGAGIASTIIPPLSAIGVGAAKLNWLVMSGSFLVFLLNVLGIVFSAIVVFSLMKLHKQERTVKKVLSVEDSQNGHKS